MSIKHKHHNNKVRYNLRFLIIVGVIGICTFLIADITISRIVSSAEKEFYKVSPLDESSIYGGSDRKGYDMLMDIQEGQLSRLNGTTAKQNFGGGQALGVIIENYDKIRHLQAGLDKAAIIYETLAEGGITRFLAIFDGIPAETIGPVRSARPYFISWASEYRACMAHVGGSNEALENLKNNFRLFNVDEKIDDTAIWRNNEYSAPHNAFTSTYNLINSLNAAEYYHPVESDRFPFKDADKQPGDIRNIDINFSLDAYEVKYVFDTKTSTYSRYNGGVLNDKIRASDIIVQFADAQALDDAGRMRIQTNGTGHALVFRDGNVIEGTWEKDSSINSDTQPMEESWTKFYDKTGKEIEMNRGQIWIEVVPNGNAVNYF